MRTAYTTPLHPGAATPKDLVHRAAHALQTLAAAAVVGILAALALAAAIVIC